MGVWRKKCLMIMDYVNASIEIIRYIVSKYDTHGLEKETMVLHQDNEREREREREKKKTSKRIMRFSSHV